MPLRSSVDEHGRLAKALADVKKGLVVGPFETVDDAIASMKRKFKKRSARKKA